MPRPAWLIRPNDGRAREVRTLGVLIAGVYAVVRYKEAREQRRAVRERLLGQ